MHSRYENRMSQSCLSQRLETTHHKGFLFFTCHYSQEKICQVFRLRFWPATEQKNDTTMSLVTTPWPQFHILICDGQCTSVFIKYSLIFLPFTIHSCWSAAMNPFLLSYDDVMSMGQMSLLGLQLGSPQPLGRVGCSETVSIEKHYLQHTILQKRL